MLATALLPVLRKDHQVFGVGSKECDIRDAEAVSAVFRSLQPELVFHLAAYTNVEGCESDPQLANETNSVGTRNVAGACALTDAVMVYVSSDYVFDGAKMGPYFEDDQPHPINVYGQSKLLGEQHVRANLKRYYIVRTSWLYGPNGRNFVSTILQTARQQKIIRVVDDQRGSPTYTRHFAVRLASLTETAAYGVYHLTGSGSCSWFEFAKAIVDLWPFEDVHLESISSSESGRLANRPLNSVLENGALRALGVELMPHWKAGLAEYLNEIRHRDNHLFGDLPLRGAGQEPTP